MKYKRQCKCQREDLWMTTYQAGGPWDTLWFLECAGHWNWKDYHYHQSSSSLDNDHIIVTIITRSLMHDAANMVGIQQWVKVMHTVVHKHWHQLLFTFLSTHFTFLEKITFFKSCFFENRGKTWQSSLSAATPSTSPAPSTSWSPTPTSEHLSPADDALPYSFLSGSVLIRTRHCF